MTIYGKICSLTLAVLLLSANLSAAETMSLGDFVTRVWASNKDIKSSRVDLDLAGVNIKGKESLYDPGFTASVVKNHTSASGSSDSLAAKVSLSQKVQTGADIALSLSSSKTDQNTAPYNSGANLSITQPLSSGYGKDATEFQIDTARLDLKKAQQNFIKLSSTTLINAISSYFDYFLSYKNKEISEKNLEHSKFVYEENQKKEKLNLATPYDVMEAKIAYKKAEDDTLVAQNNINKNAETLSRYINGDISENTPFVPTNPSVPSRNFAFAADLLSNNSDLLYARINLAKTQGLLNYDKNQGLPGTFMDAAIGYGNSAGSYGDSLALSKQNYSLGLRLQYFLNNQKNQSIIDTDQLVLTQQQLDYDNLLSTLASQTKNRIIDLNELQERMITAKEIVQLSEDFVLIENRKFNLGLITTDKIVLDQNSLNTARLNYYTIITDYLKNYYQLEMTKGELLNGFGLK